MITILKNLLILDSALINIGTKKSDMAEIGNIRTKIAARPVMTR